MVSNINTFPTIKILIGLPRSGKSTWAMENRTESDVIVSADQLRLIYYGVRFCKEKEDDLWKIRNVMFKALLQQKKNLIIDETNITKKRRASSIQQAKQHGYKVIGIVFKNHSSIEELHERAINTNQKDLTRIIDRMNAFYEEPEINEGFDELIVYSGDTIK